MTTVKNITAPEILVYIAPTTLEQIYYLVDLAPKEVGWYCQVQDESDGADILLTIHGDVHIYAQEVSGTEVDATAEDIASLIHELAEADIDHTTLRCHGHSHVNMSVSPSVTDKEHIEKLHAAGYTGKFIALIVNKKRDISCRVYDFDQNIYFEGVEVHIDYPIDYGFKERIQAAYKQHVSEQKIPATWGNTPNRFGPTYAGTQLLGQTKPSSTPSTKQPAVAEYEIIVHVDLFLAQCMSHLNNDLYDEIRDILDNHLVLDYVDEEDINDIVSYIADDSPTNLSMYRSALRSCLIQAAEDAPDPLWGELQELY